MRLLFLCPTISLGAKPITSSGKRLLHFEEPTRVSFREGNGEVQLLDIPDELCLNGVWKRVVSTEFHICNCDFEVLSGGFLAPCAVRRIEAMSSRMGSQSRQVGQRKRISDFGQCKPLILSPLKGTNLRHLSCGLPLLRATLGAIGNGD